MTVTLLAMANRGTVAAEAPLQLEANMPPVGGKGGLAESGPAGGEHLLPLPGPKYYWPEELTKRPQPVTPIDFDAPEIAGIVAAGSMTLTIWIDEFGAMADVKVERTDLPPIVVARATAIFGEARFTPGEIHNQAVRTVMRIVIDFDDHRLPAR